MRRRAWLALTVMAAILAGALTFGSAAARSEPVQITEGTLSWGFKHSWRQYVGVGELSRGLTVDPLVGYLDPFGQAILPVYQFPIVAGSYDPARRVAPRRVRHGPDRPASGRSPLPRRAPRAHRRGADAERGRARSVSARAAARAAPA